MVREERKKPRKDCGYCFGTAYNMWSIIMSDRLIGPCERLRDYLTDDTNSKLSGVAVVQLQHVADVISGEHVTLLPCDGDDVVVHVTEVH